MPSETFVVSDGIFMSDAHRTGGKPGSVSDSHSSRHTVAGMLKQPTRTLSGQRHCVLFGLAPNGVWPAAYCYQMRGAPLPHLFTLTCAAFSDGHRRFCSLFHFPSRCRARPLAGIPPCGARTFLPVCLAAIRSDCLSGLYARRIIAQGGARPSETAAKCGLPTFSDGLASCRNVIAITRQSVSKAQQTRPPRRLLSQKGTFFSFQTAKRIE